MFKPHIYFLKGGLLHSSYAILGKSMLMRIKQQGFTIVELLIVIVVIAILASIAVVGYGGLTRRADHSAITTHLK